MNEITKKIESKLRISCIHLLFLIILRNEHVKKCKIKLKLCILIYENKFKCTCEI